MNVSKFALTAAQSMRFGRAAAAVDLYLAVDEELERDGWTKSRRDLMLLKAQRATHGIHCFILRNDLAEVDRRLDLAFRALDVVVAFLAGDA